MSDIQIFPLNLNFDVKFVYACYSTVKYSNYQFLAVVLLSD